MALLGVAIAANTVIFSVVDALLLRPLPVRDPERLIRLVTVRPVIGARSYFLHEEYEAWRKDVAGFEDLFASFERDMYVRIGESAERSRVHLVTDNYFAALGVKAALGRLLSAEDDARRAGTVPVVLSYPYWQRRLSADPNIVGREIEVNGRKAVVVGVTGRGFNGLTVETSPDLRAPIGSLRLLNPVLYEDRVECEVAAYLRPGVSARVVRQQAEAIWRNGWNERHRSDPGEPGEFQLEPAARGVSRVRAQYAGVLWLLMGGVTMLGLMVCANVAGLLVARAAGRQGEIAIRVAIGATRFRLVRQFFSEALLLMLGGAAAAVALAAVAVPFTARALPPVRDLAATKLPVAIEIAADWRVLGFSLAASAATVLLFGLAPSFWIARQDVNPLLKEARTGGGWRGRQLLVVAQVALCTVVLVGAGLMVLTLRGLERMDAGFDRTRIVTFTIDPAMAGYTPEQAESLRKRLLDGARALPGVEAVAAASRGLMRGTGLKMTVKPAGERAAPADFMNSSMQGVSPEYFGTMRIPLLAGRNFTGREDLERTPKPVIVNQSFVRRFGDPLGRKFGGAAVNSEPAKPVFEVIGVVGDAKYRSLREPFHPVVYQALGKGEAFILHVRTRGLPEAAIAPVRRLLAEAEPRLSYIEVTTLAGEVAASLWAERVAAFLASMFAVLAALIAAAGLYALLAFAVTQRRREIGIRVALGARPADVISLIAGRAALLAATGIAAGAAAAWAVTPRIQPLLYGVDARSPTPMLAAAAVLLVVASGAALAPSMRAANVAPAVTLREE